MPVCGHGRQGSGWWYANYARSKLCNTLFTAELQRRLARTGSSIAAYCVSPGRVATGIYQNTPGFLRTIGKPFTQAFFQTPAQVTVSALGVGGLVNRFVRNCIYYIPVTFRLTGCADGAVRSVLAGARQQAGAVLA